MKTNLKITKSLLPIAPIIADYLPLLLMWLSELVYDRLIQRDRAHLLYQLHQQLDFTQIELACATYHQHNGNGRPVSHTVPHLVRAMLVKYLYGCSLRELEEKIRYNIIVKWFVGYPIFASGPDHTTLHRFEMYLYIHHPRLFFDTVLQQIESAFPHEKTGTLLGDTFAMHANAALESLIKRLRHTVQELLCAYQEAEPEAYTQIWTTIDHDALFGEMDETTECYLSPSERRERLLACVRATLNCQHLIRQKTVTPTVQRWLNCLDKLFADELRVELDENGRLYHLSLLTKRGTYRICSATDAEATIRNHGVNKKDFGYNISVLATIHFIHEIQADTGSRPDGDALPAVFQAYLEHHQAPDKLIYDQAAGRGKTAFLIKQQSKGKTQLVAKPVRQKKKKEGRFGPEDFSVNADGCSLTCPNGRMATRMYRSGSGDGDNFRFVAGQCVGCNFLTECRDSEEKPTTHKSIFLSDYQAEWDQLRTYRQTEEFKDDMRLRPQIERIIAGLVLHNDARRARFRGIAKVDFQAKMCATAYNLKRWISLLLGKPTPKRRRFSAPSPEIRIIKGEVGLMFAK